MPTVTKFNNTAAAAHAVNVTLFTLHSYLTIVKLVQWFALISWRLDRLHCLP